MQESFWWWQYSDRYIISLSPLFLWPLIYNLPFPIVSVDINHYVYLLMTIIMLWCLWDFVMLQFRANNFEKTNRNFVVVESLLLTHSSLHPSLTHTHSHTLLNHTHAPVPPEDNAQTTVFFFKFHWFTTGNPSCRSRFPRVRLSVGLGHTLQLILLLDGMRVGRALQTRHNQSKLYWERELCVCVHASWKSPANKTQSK